MKLKKYLALALCVLLTLGLFAACGKTGTEGTADADSEQASQSDAEPQSQTSTAPASQSQAEPQNTEKEKTDMEHTLVKFTMENGGTFTMELYPEYAPTTVANFISLVKRGYYSGTEFHRVYPGFMAQGGEGESVPSIKGEFASNGFAQNTLKHTRGVVSMARTSVKDSASSQFFICYADAPTLDGDYAAFGKVIDGMDTVDDFLKIERTYNGFDREPTKPLEPIVIAGAEIVK